MNELLISMSNDMRINRYFGESENSFTYRLLYSSLGLWCLWTANNGEYGSTKHNQTLVINELMQRYNELFPGIIDKFIDSNNPNLRFPVHMRRVYEETGYLITNENNRNQTAYFGRSLNIGNTSLYFGIPNKLYTVNGLGLFTSPTEYSVTTRELLIRDELSVTDYVHAKYNIAEFYEADIRIEELQFFNPLSKKAISHSWSGNIVTDYSVARTVEHNSYYRVVREPTGAILFANEVGEMKGDSLSSFEYRRLYYALKAYYSNPSIAKLIDKDDSYVVLKLNGHLPNREYFFLLLMSWPYNNAFNKTNFLFKKEFIADITALLSNLGIKVIGG
ncbi:hypothetical protein Theco_2806 [Thermobacillus composti KWC4]|uniref:Uncharacterized protein n=1 Tax=Thermobacillus composti (strain DSM 18247 / JCM 13945 / KWC4) TaxID=717605 RepID=L0EF50_THECK|nr:hypothetical protein [Thermobacillus composti]AGA58893.1 hypothetical protein Theco_2806 [Thermobacillus composti KWC4]